MAGRIILELLAFGFAVILQTQLVCGCTSTLNCLSYPKLWCCENGRCCSSSEYLSSFNTISSSECASSSDCTLSKRCCKNGLCCTFSEYLSETTDDISGTLNNLFVTECTRSFHCPSSKWCCKNGLCCSYSEYSSETNNKDCTTDHDCTSSKNPWCCSDGDCCSISDVINNGFTLGIGIIVAIIMGVIVLIIVCSVAITCYCRNKYGNTTGVVLTPNTAQSVGMAPYAGPQQSYANQALPGQAYHPQHGPPTINQGAV